MQITISESEIKAAIRTFIHAQIKINPDMKIEIDLKATRGPEGTTAIIDIVPVKSGEVTIQQVVTKAADQMTAMATSNPFAKAPSQFTPAEIENIMAPEPKLTVDEAIASIPVVESVPAEATAPRVRNLFGGMTAP